MANLYTLCVQALAAVGMTWRVGVDPHSVESLGREHGIVEGRARRVNRPPGPRGAQREITCDVSAEVGLAANKS